MQKTIYFLGILLLTITTSCAQDGLEFYNEGVIEMNNKNYEKAIKLFKQGLQIDDISKIVNHLGIANCYFELEKYDLAKAELELCLQTEKINNEKINSDIYQLKSAIYSIEGKINEELNSLEKALIYAPDNLLLKVSLGLSKIESGREQEGITLLNEVLALKPQDAFALNNRAFGFIKLGKLEEAKKDLDASLALDADNPFLYQNYFFYFQKLGKDEYACKNLHLASMKNMKDYGYEKDSKQIEELKKTYCGKN